MSNRRFVQLTLLLTLVGFLVRIYRLAEQPASVDDFSVAITAINYLENGQFGPTMWNHPALRNIIVYWSMHLLGSGLWGVKGWSILFGTLTVPLMAAVGRRIFRSGTVALIAAFLWMLDPLTIDFSRQAINDIYLAFFPLAAIWCAYLFRDRRNPWWLVAAGVLFGLGLASKWSALFQLVPTGLLLLVAEWKQQPAGEAKRGGRVLLLVATLLVLPATIYLLTFFPWFGRGYTLAEWPSLQHAMYRETKLHTGYHKTVEGDHLAYQWFVRPVTYRDIFFFKPEEGVARTEPSAENNVAILFVIADPLVWLLVLPATFAAAYRGIRARDEGLCFLAALFFLSYLPLATTGRPIWVNTALVVLPYALLAVAWLLWEGLGRFAARNRLVAVYLSLVALLAVPQYLLAIGAGMHIPYLRDYLINRYAHVEELNR